MARKSTKVSGKATERHGGVRELQEPYERFHSKQLRSECYGRKLKVIKAGPGANSNKPGFLRLLREDDARRAMASSNCNQSGGALDEEKYSTGSRGQRAVAAPCSPDVDEFGEEPEEQASPRSSELTPAKWDVGSPTTDNEDSASSMSTLVREADPSNYREESMLMHFGRSSDRLPVTMLDQPDQCFHGSSWPLINTTDRWERVMARLSVIEDKLSALSRRRPHDHSAGGADSLTTDLQFYRQVKAKLQTQLLQSVDL